MSEDAIPTDRGMNSVMGEIEAQLASLLVEGSRGLGRLLSVAAAWGFESFAVIAQEKGERKDDGCACGDNYEGVEVSEQARLLCEKSAQPSLGVLRCACSETAIAEICRYSAE